MGQKLLQDLLGEVRHADRANFAVLHNCLHLLPGFPHGPVTKDIAGTVGEGGEIGVVAFWVEAHRPVDKIHCDIILLKVHVNQKKSRTVEIICAKVRQSFIKCDFDVLLPCAPDFTSDLEYNQEKAGRDDCITHEDL